MAEKLAIAYGILSGLSLILSTVDAAMKEKSPPWLRGTAKWVGVLVVDFHKIGN